MNRKTKLTLFLFLLIFCSCTHVYETALFHQDIAYIPKPASFDTVKTATYVSAGYDGYANTNFNDFFDSWQLNLSRGYVFKNFNLAFGAFGVAGLFQNQDANTKEPHYFNNTFFGAYGGRASANLFVNSGRLDFRYIGVEMAYSHEFGPYANDLKYLSRLPGYFVDARTDLFTVGLTTEWYFHNINSLDGQHGFRLFLGVTAGHDKLDDPSYFPAKRSFDTQPLPLFPRASYFLKIKNYFGIVETGGLHTILSLKVGYKF